MFVRKVADVHQNVHDKTYMSEIFVIPRSSPCTHCTCTHTRTHSSLKVTSLAAYKSSKRVSGKPHKVSKLVQIVDKATQNFVAVGEEIASENPEFQVWFAFVS